MKEGRREDGDSNGLGVVDLSSLFSFFPSFPSLFSSFFSSSRQFFHAVGKEKKRGKGEKKGERRKRKRKREEEEERENGRLDIAPGTRLVKSIVNCGAIRSTLS